MTRPAPGGEVDARRLDRPSDPASVRYAVAGPLRWQRFGSEWVVYCTTTGALQAADAVTAAVLSVIECSPASIDEVVSQVVESTGAASTPELTVGMSVLLDELQRIGMVQATWP